MKVDATHPLYDRFVPRWRLMRDTIEGTGAVKWGPRARHYLPIPSGMKHRNGVPKPAYTAYKTRAVFPEIVAPTVRGLAGTIHAKDFTYDLPERLEGLRERATRDGLTLESLHRRLTLEILKVGRMGIFVDAPSTGDDTPFLADYAAEAIPNWDEGGNGVNFVVLDESEPVRNPDTWHWQDVERWRVLELVDGRFQVRVFTRGGSELIEAEPIAPQRRGGLSLEHMPFTFVDTDDLTAEPDDVPLIGLGRKAIDIYRLEADYRQGLFMAGQETLFLFGVETDQIPQQVGATVTHAIPNTDARAEYVGPSGGASGRLREAIDADTERAVQQGARLFEGAQQRQAESGEALRIRRASETATLQTIARNTAAGLERALKHAAQWIGADPDQVAVTPPDSLHEEQLAPAEIDALVRGWQAGAYSQRTLLENLQRGGVISPERDLREEVATIQTESPFGRFDDLDDDA